MNGGCRDCMIFFFVNKYLRIIGEEGRLLAASGGKILKSVTAFSYYLDMRNVAVHSANTFLVFRVTTECAPLMIGGDGNTVLQVL